MDRLALLIRLESVGAITLLVVLICRPNIATKRDDRDLGVLVCRIWCCEVVSSFVCQSSTRGSCLVRFVLQLL